MTATMGFPAEGTRAIFTPDVGNLLVVKPANPAAGANLPITLPAAKWNQLVSVQFKLTTSATVANRYVNLDVIGFGGAQNIRNAATVLVTASTTNQVFQFDTAHTVSEWNTGTTVYAPMVDFPLPAGWTVQVTVDNIDTTDQIASCIVVVRQFFEWQEEN